jgi:hypothetical protein
MDSKATMQILFDEFTSPLASGGSKPLPRQSLEFDLLLDELPAEVQAKLLQHDPEKTGLSIKLLSPTSSQEMEATRAANGDALKYVTMLARNTIQLVDGANMDATKREFFWELIGPRARSVITQQFTPLIAPSEAAMGKALATLKVG